MEIVKNSQAAFETISVPFYRVSYYDSSGSLAFYLDIFKICAAILLFSHISFSAGFFLPLLRAPACAYRELAFGINQTQPRAFPPRLRIDRHPSRCEDDNGRHFNRNS